MGQAVTFENTQIFPAYLLRDKNGAAICAAVKTALDAFLTDLQTGIDLLFDIDSMPEWRLDEYAWELGCLYDYTGSVASKRKWLKSAGAINRINGTKAALEQYLKGVFTTVLIEEWFDYDTDSPYHFRVTVTGNVSQSSLSWLQKAVARVKPARAVMDALTHISEANITVTPVSLVRHIMAPMSGDDYTGLTDFPAPQDTP